jgi:hypothetical protein
MPAIARITSCFATILLLGLPAMAQKAPALISGGKVHVRRAEVGGVTHRVEIQFFKARSKGQCWNAVGRDKAGNIYLGASTHGSNSYVYQLDPRTKKMRYLGDLLSNVRFGGRGGSENGKIHSSFHEGPDGGVYFLSHCGYIGNLRYGGRLWKYDPKLDKIVDQGVPMPGSTNFCMTRIDPQRPVTYTISMPTGILIRCDLKAKTFTALRRTGKNWVRHLPVDKRGDFYILNGNRILRYDGATGDRKQALDHKTDNPEHSFGAVSAFCWNAGRTRIYFLSYVRGQAFAWTVGSDKIEPLGRMHPEGRDLYLYNLHLNKAGTKLYSIGATSKRTDKGFYMLDVRAKKSHKLFAIDEIIEHELDGKVRSKFAYVDFTGYGGVTGDDGTMYAGFHGGGKDQDRDPGGQNLVALVAIRVKEGDE